MTLGGVRLRARGARVPLTLVAVGLACCGVVRARTALRATQAQTATASRASARTQALPLIGAYYYLWYPENLAQGSLGSHLVPPAGPAPADEVSASPDDAARAISQATSAGIDFFALDYWANRLDLNARIESGFLQAPNLSSIHFAINYETQALGPNVAYPVATAMTPAAKATLVANMVAIAQAYFNNPQYLRIEGRPVVFWYLSRTMTGDVAAAVEAVRVALANLGYNIYIVGDEVFWRVTTVSGTETTEPQVDRARLFDAVTWYNLYDASTPAFAGYGSKTSFLSASEGLVNTYRTALGPKTPVIPDVLPGYNDRATRPTENHPAVPRQWGPGEPDGSFLAHELEDLAAPNIDPNVPMLMVTSWNEWNEQTAVEPVSATVATSLDDSATGRRFTQGYTYGGSGEGALDALRSFAAGRPVVTASANPFDPSQNWRRYVHPKK